MIVQQQIEQLLQQQYHPDFLEVANESHQHAELRDPL